MNPSSNLAACTFAAPTEPKSAFRIFPAGTFRAADGRPAGLPGWIMDTAAARAIIDQLSQSANDKVIDYEHQSIAAASNGKPNPAAGWFNKIEWRPGDGLYVLDARWTAAAAAMLRQGEYRYVSPVFAFDKRDGRVLNVHSVALTNMPAMDGLTDLAAASLGRFSKRAALTANSSAADIAKAALSYQTGELAAGRFVSTPQAVHHVTSQACI